ncbi:hypothetical protein [Hydrogenophaga sp. 2FB]|uniref:hypothetical protein n=1 Tax=Hydrogenophaga sp. 2FB TaxID=2502187 RepID=UPI0010F4BC1E|nr:hypothetical protein [Hydrogenophaga sp. 2FB]
MYAYNRLTDNDRHFGPIDIGERGDSWRPLGITIKSGDEENSGCALYLRALGWTVRVRLPAVVKPWRTKIQATYWDAATIERMGRDWYWDIHPREYGFQLSDGFLQVFLGAQTHDSTTTQSWSKFLPWTQLRHIRTSYYDGDGRHFWTEWSRPRGFTFRDQWASTQAAKKACPTAVFEFDDYDGKRIRATCRVEEREYRHGEGWFKWLSLFRSRRICRSLSLEFSEEVGPEKGSWKGGTTGHGIDMLPDESPEAAFRRYCEQEHRDKNGRYRITYVGRVEG